MKILFAVFVLVTQTGCALLLSQAIFTETTDRYSARPEESGVKLTCAGSECSAARPEARYSRKANPYIFGGGVLLETGATFLAASQSNGTLSDKYTWAAAGLGLLVFLDLFNALSGLDNQIFARSGSCCGLPAETYAEWKGRRVLLKVDDVTEGDEEQRLPLETFSVERALARAGGGTPVGAGKPGLLKQGSRLGVLDFKDSTGTLRVEDARYLSDVVRKLALEVKPKLEVMTKESMVAALEASLTKSKECGAECEVETGRRIGADGLVTGEVIRLGAGYKLNLLFHETKSGALLSTAVAGGNTMQELEASLQLKGAQLLRER